MPTPVARSILAGGLSAAARALDGLAAAAAPPSRRVLVLGGARSGKSAAAERLMRPYPAVSYLATGPVPDAADADWAERVRLHRQRRPAHWHTVETPPGRLPAALAGAERPVLIDCLGTWLGRVLDEAGAWEEAPGWREHAERAVTELVRAYRESRVPVVTVSNEVGSGVVPATWSGRAFRDVLGSVNHRVADASDRALLVVAGRQVELCPPRE